ncbi:DUF2177 family protein [Rhodoblastus sp.]|uniref:DUF2177 family protein n=1 Tax=Rhodoblastus sp. TaxID=1962975 RepID=UPI0035B34EF8
MKTLAAFAATLIVFAGVDFLWLSRMAGAFYRPAMGGLALDGFRPGPAVVFYLLYAAGVAFFAVRPGLAAQSWQSAALHGLAFGLVGYGVYDLTNQATLKHWPLALTVVDMAWGSFLTALAASAGYGAGRLF